MKLCFFKLLFIPIFCILLNGLPLISMEIPIAEEEFRIESLPIELHAIITHELLTAPSAQVAIKNIKNFLISNKAFASLLSDRITNKTLIRLLAEKYFNNDFVKAALALGTVGAKEALKEYLESSQQALKAVKVPLFEALFKNETRAVINLINAGADPNSHDAKLGRTPAMIAAEKNNLELLNYLLLKKVDFNAKDKQGNTPLIYAIRAGKNDAIVFLLDIAKVSINEANNGGFTPLIWAIHKNRSKIAQVLIEKGADVLKKDKKNTTPLMEAAVHGETGIVKILISKKVPVNEVDIDGVSAILLATFHPATAKEIIKLLLDAGADPKIIDRKGGNLLYYASLINPEVLKLILSTSAKTYINTLVGNYTPLSWAGLVGNLDMVKELLNAGADIKIKSTLGRTILADAIASNPPKEEIIKAVLATKPTKEFLDAQDNFGQNALYLAVTSDNASIVKDLLMAGADPNIPGLVGTSPLIQAVLHNKEDIIKLLLNFKADPLYVDPSNRTAIDYAADPEIKKLLEEYAKLHKK